MCGYLQPCPAIRTHGELFADGGELFFGGGLLLGGGEPVLGGGLLLGASWLGGVNVCVDGPPLGAGEVRLRAGAPLLGDAELPKDCAGAFREGLGGAFSGGMRAAGWSCGIRT
jgi:hypothetical protein